MLDFRTKNMNRLNVWRQLAYAREWTFKGIFAVIDQALFSGSNFIVNILLARWLPPEEYGAFVVALSVFYLLAGFHTAVLTEPMMVFGAGKYREQFQKYFGMVIWGHWGLSIIIALGLGVTAWVFSRAGSATIADSLFGLAIASPFLLLIWLTRRACYAQLHLHPALAVVGSGLNLLIILVGSFFLWCEGIISPFSGFLLLGAAGGLGSLPILGRLKPQVTGYVRNPTPSMVFTDHWGYGRWIMLEGIFYSLSAQLWLILVPVFLGLRVSAALAAIWNLYRPVSLFMQAIGLILLPTFANWNRRMQKNEFRIRTLKIAILFACAVGLYGFILTIIAEPFLHFLYHGKYDQYQILVPLYGAATTFVVLVQNFIVAIKASMMVSRLFIIWGVAAATCVFVSVPLMLILGATGAVTGYLLGYALASVVAYRMLGSISS